MKIDIPDFVREFILNLKTRKDGVKVIPTTNNIPTKIKEWCDTNYNIQLVKTFVLNNIKEWPICKTCGKKLNESQIIRNKKFCSLSCSNKSPEAKEKAKQTNLQKYGTEHQNQSEEIKNKSKQTCLARYGVDTPFKSKEIKAKAIQTIIQRYGVDNVWKSKSIQNKIKDILLERYGVEHSIQNADILAKMQNTNIKRYGVHATMLRPERKLSFRINNRTKNYDKFVENAKLRNIEPLFTQEEYINSQTVKCKCNKCNTIFEINPSENIIAYCKECTSYNVSENSIYNFIKSVYNGNIIQHDRKILNGKELDIYIPEKKLAIEFNGSYWHSELYKHRTFHQEKTLACREQNIRLIHVSEHDWNNKQEIVKSIISSALGVYQKRIYARKCILQEISSREYREFLEKNHIQGAINSKYKYGLFYQGELVSVFGYGQSRFKKGELELHRFCSLLNTQVIGAFSKFLKNVIHETLITFVDLSYFDGSGYFKNGFKQVSISTPAYFYIINNNKVNRLSVQKHKLKNMLKVFDENLTEHENMLNNNLLRIYDSGSLKLKYK